MLSNILFRMSLLKILIFFSTLLIMLLSLLVTPSFAVDRLTTRNIITQSSRAI